MQRDDACLQRHMLGTTVNVGELAGTKAATCKGMEVTTMFDFGIIKVKDVFDFRYPRKWRIDFRDGQRMFI